MLGKRTSEKGDEWLKGATLQSRASVIAGKARFKLEIYPEATGGSASPNRTAIGPSQRLLAS
jgi:hypothetical protein